MVDALEDKRCPEAGPTGMVGIWNRIGDAFGFPGLPMVVNLFALIVYPPLAPIAHPIFHALNGYPLGREYFSVAPTRRLNRGCAAEARKRHPGTIGWRAPQWRCH